MQIGLIGCGRVGLTIGYFLRKKNLLYGVFDKDKNVLKRAIKILAIKRNPRYEDLIKNSNILLFATPDDEIINAYNEAKKYIIKRKYLFHFSGLLPAEIFPPKMGLYRASVHPFATFPQIAVPPRKTKYNLFIQGDRESIKVIRKIFCPPHFTIRKIEKEQKPLYHLLGVFSSNFVVSLSEALLTILKKLGWSRREFELIILPMILDSLNNVKRYGVKLGLSGPIVRGDAKTIEKNLKTLKANPDLYNTYLILSRLIIKYGPPTKQKLLRKILKIN